MGKLVDHSAGVDYTQAIAMGEMVVSLKRAGWTGADLKSYVEQSKRENFIELDTFTAGELSKLKGFPLFPTMLEATALRYAMHTTNAGGTFRAVPSECPHGFRMVACNSCLKGAA